MQPGDELVELGESHTCSGSNLRNEVVQSMSIQPPAPPPHGKNMCQASGTGHRVQMPPAFEGLGLWGLKGRAPHWATVQLKVHIAVHLRTSWPAALVSKGSEPLLVLGPDMELWANAHIHKTAQGINGPIMSNIRRQSKMELQKTSEGPRIPFQKSASPIAAKVPILGSHLGFEITARTARKFFNVVKLWWNHFTL